MFSFVVRWHLVRRLLFCIAAFLLAGSAPHATRIAKTAEEMGSAPAGVAELLFVDSASFSGDPDFPGYTIFRSQIDNRPAERLTLARKEDGLGARYGDWSPDGEKIVFAASFNGVAGIYVIDATGGDPTLLNSDPESRDPAWSPDGEKIVFHGWVNGDNLDIAVMDADGSNVTPITDDAADDMSPAWSPDGETIAFTSYRDGNAEIYLIDPDGTDLRRLTNDDAIDDFPSWSPDSSRLAFMSQREGEPAIYLMDASGDNQVAVTNGQDGHYDDFPSWSPDGTQLIFTRRNEGGVGLLYSLVLATAEIKRLTWHGNDDFYPDWSPDGKQIVFARYDANDTGTFQLFVLGAEGEAVHLIAEGMWPDANPRGSRIAYTSPTAFGNPEIAVMDRDGSNRVVLTNNAVVDRFPSWSADGLQIVYERFGENDTTNIFKMNADGSDQKALTTSGSDGLPRWSPRGDKIAFVSVRDGNPEIYIMNPDGSHQQRLTNDSASDLRPDWSPDGSKIVFTSDRDRGVGIYVMDANGSNVTRLSPPGDYVWNPTWSPDGSLIAYADDGIWVMNADGSQPRQVTVAGSDPNWLPSEFIASDNIYLPLVRR